MTTASGAPAEKKAMEKTDSSHLRNCPKEGQLARVATKVEAIEQRMGDIYSAQLHTVDRLDKLIPAVARLEVKAGVWGGVGGLVAALVMAGVAVLAKM
ncbi:MAG: hypothetical protein FVQ81_05405 [Candidatus Glassbacteria bacterium]|nr:hypothetical protein [Candidatus Glassbacteria bacterium]